MNRHSKRHLKDPARRETPEQEKSRKLAGKIRRAAKEGKGVARDKHVTAENWEALLDRHGRSERRLRENERTSREFEETPPLPGPAAGFGDAAMVISVASGRCRLFHHDREIDCLVPPELAVQQKSALAVGDRVTVVEESGVHRIESVLPRRTVLARPDPINPHRQRLIAANIDIVVHVVSVKAPPLRPRLIDRFLIAIQRGGAQPVICVNKIDLLPEAERARQLAPLGVYRELGVPLVPSSVKSGEGLDELRRLVLGRTAALVGHSGVGKSSILNALDARLQLATKTLHKRGTGRHSTTASTLYDFGEGTFLIDTPGIREFGLWNLDRDALRDYFPEFDQPAESCRFTDCTHVHEPDCEVKDAVERGEIHRARYETYVRLYDDLKS
ncbi:MAG TPA: ribosome small subunit-dependent GTPase A [Thermoanaerobaculia bacterium]|nr:ribosome small subunit-dependent GTPase A [Thermoanaerobaculia bacterium]